MEQFEREIKTTDENNCASNDAGACDEDESAEQAEILEKLLKSRYKINSILGSGAQGAVYLGRRLSDGKDAAIKQMRISSLSNWKQYELFRREAQVLSGLDIDGVARFYESVEDLDGENPVSVIVQEYIDGKSLESYLKDGRRFRFEDVCGILIQLLDILEKLHHHNPQVIHRDVKPSNVILHYDNGPYSSHPKVYLIDFGAVANPQVQDGGSTVTGTYGYMAPEQLIGKPEPASDIYSLGVLAVYLLSGTQPEDMECRDLQLVIDPYLENYPHAVSTLLRHMLVSSPKKRYCNYGAIREALEKFANQEFDIQLKGVDDANISKQYTLDKVHAVGQIGNIDLWQNFSESVPRKIPRGYGLMLSSDFWNFMLLSRSNPKKCQFHSYTPKSHLFKRIIFNLSCVVNIAYLPICLYAYENIYQFNAVPAALIFILLTVINILLIYKRIKITKELSRVLKIGRKTLAAVESVTLFPDYRSIDPDSRTTLMTWRIEYSFNPPDDMSASALHHEYYSLTPPKIKAGDMLPILYEIGRDKYSGAEYVHSMPFPLPSGSSFLQCGDLVSDDLIHIGV